MNLEKILEELPARIEDKKAAIQEMYIQFGFLETPSVDSFFDLTKKNESQANEILAFLFPETQETANAAGAILSLAGSVLNLFQTKQENAATSLELAYEQIEEQQKTLKTAKIFTYVALAALVILVITFFLHKKH